MAINLDQHTAYQVRLGPSIRDKANKDSEDIIDGGFHLVSKQLPRNTTKVSRETLENGTNVRARLLSGHSQPGLSQERSSKNPLMLEIDTADQKSTCIYEGEYESISRDSDEVDCVLLYDEETKSLVIERLSSSSTVKSGSLSGGTSADSSTTASQLALPANKYVAPPKREAPTDDPDDDELARELEGALLDDMSGDDHGVIAFSVNGSKRGSIQRHSRQASAEDRLKMELAENIDEALQDAFSDEDQFEEVDGAQFLAKSSAEAPSEDDVKSIDDEQQFGFDDDIVPKHEHGKGDIDDDSEMMVFEEIDPSADLPSTGLKSAAASDSDEFEDIGSLQESIEFSNNDIGASDSLFGDSARSSPNPSTVQRDDMHQGPDIETSSEFDDLENDLARSLENS